MDNYDVIFDDYSLEEIRELVGDNTTQSFSTFSKYSFALLAASSTMMAANLPHEHDLNSKPDIDVMSNTDSFALRDYQDALPCFEDYGTLVCGSVEKRKMISAILSFRSLNQSWDGFGAIPAQIDSASNAISIIEEYYTSDGIENPSDIFPNPNGTISMQWENIAGERISIEVGDKVFSYYTKFGSLEPEFFDNVPFNTVNLEDITGKIKALF